MKYILIPLVALIIYYLVVPSPGFPQFPPNTLISNEPADTESIYRRAFFSNYSRAELMDYFQKQNRVTWLPFNQIRLNHPPEEAYTLIRDQTPSSWLEELTLPWRDTLYINGFYPTKPTEQINRNGVHYENKITLHYFPNHPISRLTVLGLTLISDWPGIPYGAFVPPSLSPYLLGPYELRTSGPVITLR